MSVSSEKFEAILDYAEYLKEEHKAKPLSEVYKYIVQTTEWSPREAEKTPFTYITLIGINPAVRDALMRPGNSLQDTVDSVQELSGVDYLRWSLGLLVPVKYKHKDGPISSPSDKVVQSVIDRLDKYDFHVFMNDAEVFKPIYLPSYKEKSTSPWKINKDWKVYSFKETLLEGALTFSGYIVNQRTMIIPRELQGILIRIQDVGIGHFRKDILGVKDSSNVFSTTISGEIFVESGLEEALTFDRAGFRVADPHYIAIADWIEEKIKEIKSDFWARGKERSIEKKKARTASVQEKMISAIGGYLGGPYSQKGFTIKETRKKDIACEVDPNNGLISINSQHPVFKNVSPKEEEIVQIFLYALEIAKERSGKDVNKMYEETIKIATDLLEKRASKVKLVD